MDPIGDAIDGTEAVELVSVVVAAIGYIVKYRTDLKLAQRDDRLQRIHLQLSEFYGLLIALTRSSDESWRAFRGRHRPHAGSFWLGDAPTPDEVLAWRLWMTTVFPPVSERIADLVHTRADLIEEPEMPPCLLPVCAHVASYQALVKERESGAVSRRREDNVSVVAFPGQQLADYAAVAFGRLKAEQSILLGASAAMPQWPKQRPARR